MRGRHIPSRVFAIVIGLLTLSGCATALVNTELDIASHPIVELGRMKTTVKGLIVGETEQNNIRYLRVLLSDARQACGSTKPLELLLPLSGDTSPHAILREADISAPEKDGNRITVYGTISSRPPELTDNCCQDMEKTFKGWLSTLDLNDKPVSPVIIEDAHHEGLNVYYRLPDSSAQMRPADIEADWVCRSRIKSGGISILYVPAVLFDLITLPFYPILIVMSAH